MPVVLVFFFVDSVCIVEQLIEQLVEKWRHTVVEILRMERVLFHLVELVALENETQKPVMGLLQALEVVLEHLILSLNDLYLSECELGVEAILDVV